MGKANHPASLARDIFRQSLRFDFSKGILLRSALRLANVPPAQIKGQAGGPVHVKLPMTASDQSPLIPPAIVCAALSVELGLKCIQAIESQPITHTHDLSVLF